MALNILDENELIRVKAYKEENKKVETSQPKGNKENLHGWVYNQVSGNITEEIWNTDNIKRKLEAKEDFVLNNILYPYNRQAIRG